MKCVRKKLVVATALTAVLVVAYFGVAPFVVADQYRRWMAGTSTPTSSGWIFKLTKPAEWLAGNCTPYYRYYKHFVEAVSGATISSQERLRANL